MSNYGSNSFVIEGEKGVEIYNTITKAYDKCVELNQRYEIGIVNDMVYTVEKSEDSGSEIIIAVWDNSDYSGAKWPIAYSWIDKKYVELKEGNLHISERWRNTYGVLLFYISDTKLHYDTNVYIETSCEADIVGLTNDAEGRYFKRCCMIMAGECTPGDGTIPENYYDFPFDEQLSICQTLEAGGKEIYYDTTNIVETEKFFG
jgi:hypothetical protein